MSYKKEGHQINGEPLSDFTECLNSLRFLGYDHDRVHLRMLQNLKTLQNDFNH
ncbi:MAG: hypothetical protein ACJAVN_000793 [Roseivirga sp.]|jgi:hypothetical protein